MDLKLANKVALVTGGSRGIGLRTARLLAEVRTDRDALVAWHLLRDRDAAIATAAAAALEARFGRPRGLEREGGAPSAADCERWKDYLGSAWR